MTDAIAMLERARAGDIQALGEDPAELAGAIRSLVAARDVESALELFARTWRVWHVRGEPAEGMAAGASVLDGADPAASTTWRVRALYGDGVLAFRAGDNERSRVRNEEALVMARGLDDVRGECEALTGLARVALREGRYADVVRLALEGRERAHAAGDRAAEAAPLHLQAAGERLQQRYDAAKELYLESLELNRGLGNEAWISMEQHNLGWVELHRGDVSAAEKHFRARDEHVDGDPLAEAWSELSRAGVAVARGDRAEARNRYDRGLEMLRKLQVKSDPDDAAELAWLEARLADRTP